MRAKIFSMAIIRKTVRMEQAVSERFAEHCQSLGIVQERTAEALFVYALTLDEAQTGELLKAAREWKATHGDAGEQRCALAETAGESLDRAKRAAEGRPPGRKGRKAGNPGA